MKDCWAIYMQGRVKVDFTDDGFAEFEPYTEGNDVDEFAAAALQELWDDYWDTAQDATEGEFLSTWDEMVAWLNRVAEHVEYVKEERPAGAVC